MKIAPIHVLLGLFAATTGLMLLKARNVPPAQQTETREQVLARGKYLVHLGGCADCHTRKEMTDKGPVDDLKMMLAGHPEGLVLPSPSGDSGPWFASTAGMTAWTGPWGVSYTSNLTPDPETGLGTWTEEEFIATLRTGKQRGTGRHILPPMPWQPLGEATDADLKAIYAYLRSLPPVKNRVPDPQPPASTATVSGT